MLDLVASAPSYTLDDGLGARALEHHAAFGAVDVLDMGRVLAADPAIEQAIRARAARSSLVAPSLLTPVRAIDRRGASLRITAAAAAGVRLSHLLADLEFGNIRLTDTGILELAKSVLRAVALLHHHPGLVSHGAINPAHIVVRPDRSIVLTDGVFGGAFELLPWHRDQIWRQFAVAMPMSASIHRYDQRADVTQVAAVVLAIALRRQLRADEYPGAARDLVMEATPADGPPFASSLRMWLLQALNLHPRCVLASAVDAYQMFRQVLATSRVS
ncbi:MAG: hypothetical protein FJW14_01900 [Acidimicrobiia bacterium]|nr:hypothetical protein [Acidimicrobiia bacterium]